MMNMSNKTAVVIFSGGQDSTTCLYWAKKHFHAVTAITFSYGQNHSVEIEQSKIICEKAGVNQTIIDLPFMSVLSDSALLNGGDVNQINDNGLPASFVPNRNQIFITLAHAAAQKIGAAAIVTGVCQTDYSGYPDCRQEFINYIELATNSGSGAAIEIVTPLINKTKAEIWALAYSLGVLEEVVRMSHTCYNGDREHLNNWGYGCGQCEACKLRRKGYEEFKIMVQDGII